MVIYIVYYLSSHNKLCLGLNHDHDLVMMKKEFGDDSQLWEWREGNCFVNKAGFALDVKGGCSEPGKFNNYKSGDETISQNLSWDNLSVSDKLISN